MGQPHDDEGQRTGLCTHTRTHTYTHTQAETHRHTHTERHTDPERHTQTHTHISMQAKHTHTHTNTHLVSLSHTHTHTGSLPTCDWMMPWPPLNGDLRSLSLRWRLLRLLRWSCCRNLAICRRTDGRNTCQRSAVE